MKGLHRSAVVLVVALAVTCQARREGKPMRQRQRHRQAGADSLNDEGAGGTCELEISCKNYDGSMPVKLPIRGPRGPTGSPGTAGEKGDPGEPGMPGIPGGAGDSSDDVTDDVNDVTYPDEDRKDYDTYTDGNYDDGKEDYDDYYYYDYDDEDEQPGEDEEDEQVDEDELLTLLRATISPNSIFVKDPKDPNQDEEEPTRTVKYKNLTITVPSHLRVTGKEDEEYDEYIDGLMEMESDGSSIYKAEKANEQDQITKEEEQKPKYDKVETESESEKGVAEQTGVAASKGTENDSWRKSCCLLTVLSALLLAVVSGP